MVKVMFGGVFDVIHHGHIYALRKAKELGDELVVIVASDKTAHHKAPLHNEEIRRELVESIRYVDKCIIGHPNEMFKTVAEVAPDIVALGYNQPYKKKSIEEGCKKVGVNARIVRLDSNVPHIHTKSLKEKIRFDIL